MANTMATLIWILMWIGIASIGSILMYSAFLIHEGCSKEEVIDELKQLMFPTEEDLY